MSGQPYKSPPEPRHGSPSLFGAVVLIAAGVFLLLANFGRLPAANWAAVWQLWPLFLVFLGVNLIAVQFPRPWGSLLSLLTGLGAVAVFSLVAFSPAAAPLWQRAGLPLPAISKPHLETVSYPAEGLRTAQIELDLSYPPVHIAALDEDGELLEAQIALSGELQFAATAEDGRAHIELGQRPDPLAMIGLLNPDPDEEVARWRIGLSPSIPLDLRVDAGSGPVAMDLSSLRLSDLKIDGGSGALTAVLPDGQYVVRYDAASGSSQIVLPQQGNQTIRIDGASGELRLVLPHKRALRLALDGGSGAVIMPHDVLTKVSADAADEGVWQTAGYENAPERIDLQIDVSSGRVLLEIEDLGGR